MDPEFRFLKKSKMTKILLKNREVAKLNKLNQIRIRISGPKLSSNRIFTIIETKSTHIFHHERGITALTS